MRSEDIPRVPVQTHMSPPIQRLQREAPKLVEALIERTQALGTTSLSELQDGAIELLEGGNSSALYSIRTDTSLVVVKFRADGIEAEEESLRAWGAQGIAVPSIQHKGSLERGRVKFLVFDFVFHRSGTDAPTGVRYLKQHPENTRRMGGLLGRTLARMHRAKSKRTFGEFADRGGTNTAPIKSWNRYVLGYLEYHREYLTHLGFSLSLIDELAFAIERMRFASRGTYLHGDYSLRNVMVASSKPLSMVVFDPNPLIGDPSWDVAILFNNRDYSRKRYECKPTNSAYRRAHLHEERLFEGFWKSYSQVSKEKVHLEKIRLAQLLQTIHHLQTEERKRYKRREEKETEVRVRREVLFELMGSLTLGAV